jgi:hypothetical protein
MKKLSALLVGITLLVIKMHAQDTSTYFGKMNYVFNYVDKSPITTGLLRDYGIEFLNLDNYTGASLHDSNFTAMDDWRMLYTSLYSSQINNTAGMLYLDTVNRLVNKYAYTSQPISFIGLYYNYQKLRDDAVTSNLMYVSNDQLYDVSGRTQSPYESRELFAIAPIRQAAFTGDNQFIFRPELFLGNTGKTISSIAYDAAGGSNYQTVALNTAFTVNYANTGFYNFSIRITYTDNSIRYAHTKIVAYENPGSSQARFGTRAIENLQVEATKAYLGTISRGDITIELALNNTTGQIRKPLIVVEGFDPEDTYDYESFWRSLNNDPNTGASITLNTGLDNTNDYDLIFLNFQNGMDHIQRNAFLLERVIEIVNGRKTTYNGVRQDNVIIGLSMGGLIARYALRDMEQNSQAHETRLFISHDTPHWGANVPVGAQAAVQHLAPWQIVDFTWQRTIFYRDMFPQAVDALNIFNSPAARQMLIQRYTLSGESLTADNSTHNDFLNEINGMGWPVNCRNITVANGSCSGGTHFADNTTMFNIDANRSMTYFGSMWRSLVISLAALPIGTGVVTGWGNPSFNTWAMVWQFPLSLFATSSSIGIDFKIRSVPSSGTLEIYRGDVYSKKKILWLIDVKNYFIKCHVNSVSGMLPLDNARGGLYNPREFGLDPSIITNQLPDFFQGVQPLMMEFCFVPTVSALAFNDPAGNLRTNVCSNVNCLNPSGVHDFFAPQQDEFHISFTQAKSDYILQRQAANYSCAKICPANISISGDDAFCFTSGAYTLNTIPANATVTWSLNPSYFATVNCVNCNSTTLSRNYDGAGTLSATFGNTCLGQPIAITKAITRIGNSPVSGYYYSGGVYNNLVDEISGSNYLESNSWTVIHASTPVNAFPQAWAPAGGYNYSWQVNGNNELYVNVQADGYAAFKLDINGECTALTKYYIFEATGGFSALSVSPNPTTSDITVSVDDKQASNLKSGVVEEAGIRQVIIRDNLGHIVLQQSYSGKTKKATLRVSSLKTGFYIVQVFDGRKWKSHKLIKK